ncbi:MAG: PAS domain S-box protein [Ignavibacteriales bacterium]|nr:PAS domain S-box protein [Ignavibacteriales bacterium]
MNELINKSTELLDLIWECSVDGLRLIDGHGNIIMVNQPYCKMVNLEKEYLIGKLFSDVYHPSEREDVLKVYREDFINNKMRTHFERENTLLNNDKVWFDFSNSFLQLPDGDKVTLSIIKNVTARKKTELEIKESEKRYRMLFNNTNDAVFVIQLEQGSSYGRFIEVNDVACERLGYQREEFLMLSPSAIIPPQIINEYTSVMEKLFSVKDVIFELVHRAKDRRTFPVEISAHLFQYNSKQTILSVARDITERKIADEKLKRTSKTLRDLASHLQSVREEERTMIAREIHDELGQVLTVLKIQISLLSKKLNEDQQPLKDKFDSVSILIDQTVETVQKICAKLRPGILDELGLVAAIEWQSQELSERMGIQSEFIFPSDEIILDNEKSTAVFRIFQEALTNVARHANASIVHIILKIEKSNLILEIIDNGGGISETQLNAVQSLGILGMKERAMLFGGSVYIEGFPGKGTKVRVEIPYSKLENKND